VHVVLFDFFGWHTHLSIIDNRHTSIELQNALHASLLTVTTLALLAFDELLVALVAVGKDRDDDRETYVIHIQI
jgi:hypothetical protein